MFLTPCARENLIELLPQGGVCAEIGVWEGDFSAKILERAQPKTLHLIDSWMHDPIEPYRLRPENSQEAHEVRYQKVLKRFEREIASGQVVVHRLYAAQAKDLFHPHTFDWVYVDGLHTYQGAYDDLLHFAPKVKPDGFLLGDDYVNHEAVMQENYGVIEAVRDFVRGSDFNMLAMSTVGIPNFVLIRKAATAPARKFIGALLGFVPGTVELKDYVDGMVLTQKQININNQANRLISTFSALR